MTLPIIKSGMPFAAGIPDRKSIGKMANPLLDYSITILRLKSNDFWSYRQ